MSRPGKVFLLPALLLSAVPLAALGSLAGLTRALGDDFCSFYFADRFGLLRSIWYWRINWSGRYSAFAADWLAARFVGVHGLPLLLILLLMLWLLLTAAVLLPLLRAAGRRRPNLLNAFVLAPLFLLLLLVLTPDLPQSFFWWNGMRSYALPLMLLTFYALLYIGLARRLDNFLMVALGCAASFALWFLSGGLSETFAVFQFALLALLILFTLLSSRGRWPRASLPLLLTGISGAALSLWVIITAPGNVLRQVQLPPTPSLPDIWEISWRGYGYYLSGVLASPVQMSLLASALLLTLWVGSFYPVKARGWWILALLVAGFVLSFVCFPPAVYGYSEIPPARTVIIPFFALIACLLACAFLIGTWLPASLRVVAVLPALLLLAYGSFGETRLLLGQRAAYQSFARGWDRSESSILQARAAGAESVTIPAVQNWAGVNVLNDNPRFWVNVCYSQYYAIPVFGRDPG